MDKSLLVKLLLITFTASFFVPEVAARKKKEKEEAVSVILYLNKVANANDNSKGMVIKGYLRSAIVNDPTFFEVSETPNGERIRYISEDIDSLVVMDSLKYVKRKCKGMGFMAGGPKIRWVRAEYEGRGIDVYSAFFITQERVNNITTVRQSISYFFSIDKDIAIWVSSEYVSGPYVLGAQGANRKQMAYYFSKIYDYQEFATRMKAKELTGMMTIVKAWDTEYGSVPVKRISGKMKVDQQGVQETITVVSGAKSSSWKRMKNEVVFPQYMRTIQLGVSPAIAPWSRNIKHDGTGYKMYIPPISIYTDICFMDFSKLGSIGYLFGATYSKYGYNWQWDNGYGLKTKETSSNRFDICAGLSWHLTLCRNFEAYARVMIDLGVTGNRTTDQESGEKMISESKMNTNVGVIATAGLRYYFCRSVGVYVEGGRDIGYASAGLSFRF
ncbi:hypothetical protein [Coprobacter secundus]|uniref:hypothetical protein n=1 Tax=Coprobacter secundus TaxID=1501392 RepID=UPI0022E7C6BC|nr:hypothetical protein [Coprobacter secundus]